MAPPLKKAGVKPAFLKLAVAGPEVQGQYRRWPDPQPEQRRDPADHHAPVAAFRFGCIDQQALLAVSLRDNVFARHAELLREHVGHGLSAPVRQAEIVDIGTNGVGMAFDEEDLTRVLVRHIAHDSGHRLQHHGLIRRYIRGAEVEGDGIYVDAAHAVAKIDVCQHFIQRITAVERFHRSCLQSAINIVLGSSGDIDDILLARDYDARRIIVTANAPSVKPTPTAIGRFSNSTKRRRRACSGRGGKGRPKLSTSTSIRTPPGLTIVVIAFPFGARRICGVRVKPEIHALVNPDEGAAAHLNNGPVPRLRDDGLPMRIHDLLALAGDYVQPLGFDAVALGDCSRVLLLGSRLPLAISQTCAVGACASRVTFAFFSSAEGSWRGGTA